MKVIAITGGAQGIGRGIALRFAIEGYAVSLADVDEAAGQECAQLIERAGAQALFVATDVADAAAVERWVARTCDELGVPDVLVANAGIGRRAPFLDLSAADFDRVLAVNLRGTFLCAQAVARRMVAAGRSPHADGGGRSIVTLGSTRAFMSEPGTEAYTATKGGIVALTHGMAVSLGSYGIRVNCICPGWIETRDWQLTSRAETPVHSARDRLQHPVGRVGTPDDVAEACWYLAEHAGFVTGQTLVVDGGMTVKMMYEE